MDVERRVTEKGRMVESSNDAHSDPEQILVEPAKRSRSGVLTAMWPTPVTDAITTPANTGAHADSGRPGTGRSIEQVDVGAEMRLAAPSVKCSCTRGVPCQRNFVPSARERHARPLS